MILLLNLLFAALAFFVVRYMFLECGASKQIAVIFGAIMAIIVFLLNFGAQVL